LGYGPETIMPTNSGLNPVIADHGCIVMINALGDTNGAVCPIILGMRTNVSAAFLIGQVLPGAPIVSIPQASPVSFYAQSVPGTTLTVNLAGLTPFTNCWQTDGGGGGTLTNIPGTDTRGVGQLLTYAFTASTAGTYKFAVISTNKAGITTSATASVVVNPPSVPILTSDINWTNVYAFAKGNVTLSANFGTGTLPVSNQWQVKLDSGGLYANVAGANATNNSWTFSNVVSASQGFYHLVATNIIGNSTSSPSHLKVIADPPPPTNYLCPSNVYSLGPIAYWRLGETYPPIYDQGIEPWNTLIQIYDYSGKTNYGSYGLGAQVDDGSSPYPGPQPPSAGGFYPGFEATNYCMLTVNAAAESKAYVPALNLNTNAVTITMWINPGTVVPIYGSEGLFMWGNGNDKAGFGFGSRQDANLVAELGYTWNSNAPATYNWHSGLYPPKGYWSFAALTITPTSSTVYLMYATQTITNAFKSVNTLSNIWERFSAGTTWIGSDSYDGRNFGGMIDEVAVYNKSLDETQIQGIFLKALKAPGVAPSFTQQPTPGSIKALPTQIMHVTANGGGIPTPTYQWQSRAFGSSDPFVNMTEGVGLNGSQSGSLTVTSSVSMDMRVVLNNTLGSATSDVATLEVVILPVPVWTINFQYTNTGAGYGATPPFIGLGMYTGLGALGTGHYWNSVGDTNPTPGYYSGPRYSELSTLLEDGVTVTDVTCTVQSGGNFTCLSYTTNQDNILVLEGMYAQLGGTVTANGLVFSNCPAGNYQLVCYAVCGTWANRGAIFVYNNITNADVNASWQSFIFSDNCVLIQNITAAADNTITVGMAANTKAPGNSASPEGDFNGCQLQYLGGGNPPSPITNVWDGTHLTLTWSGGALYETTNLITGPWNVVPGATSPYEITPTDPMMFYRLQQ
jgi:hypothetical protein